jgi:acyl carrier protein
MSLRDQIKGVFAEVFVQQTKRTDVPELQDDTVLLETGLDSLGFAVLVVRLEEELGFDPFMMAEEAYYPRTFGEFVTFYENAAP